MERYKYFRDICTLLRFLSTAQIKKIDIADFLLWIDYLRLKSTKKVSQNIAVKIENNRKILFSEKRSPAPNKLRKKFTVSIHVYKINSKLTKLETVVYSNTLLN